MTTSIGHDAPTSCASFRAGLTRPAALDYFEVHSESEDEPVAVTGHPAAVPAASAEGLGKMLALGAQALRELLSRPARAELQGIGRVGVYLALPNYSLREETFIDVNRAENLSPAAPAEEDEGPVYSIAFAQQCNEHLLPRLIRAAGVNLVVDLQRNVFGDQGALVLALHAAMRDLIDGRVERCIVGGIDSYLDPDSLQWAEDSSRLKVEGQPCGFAPGEAAVFLELTTRELAAASGEPVQAWLSAPSIDRERVDPKADTGPQGVALASAIVQALERDPAARVGLIIGALNGEVGCAQDWGFALNRLIGAHPTLGELRNWHPATSFGETGCAAMGLAIGIGAQAFQRHYARADNILIWLSSDMGIRAALVLADPSR